MASRRPTPTQNLDCVGSRPARSAPKPRFQSASYLKTAAMAGLENLHTEVCGKRACGRASAYADAETRPPTRSAGAISPLSHDFNRRIRLRSEETLCDATNWR